MRVLTTSMGVVTPCDSAAAAPPAAKYRQSKTAVASDVAPRRERPPRKVDRCGTGASPADVGVRNARHAAVAKRRVRVDRMVGGGGGGGGWVR